MNNAAKAKVMGYFSDPLDREFWLIILTTWTIEELNAWSDFGERTRQGW